MQRKTIHIVTLLTFGSLYGKIYCKNATGKPKLNLAILIPWTQEWEIGPKMGSGVVLGIQEVERRGLLSGYDIEWTLRDTYCKPRQGLSVAVNMWSYFDENLAAFIGSSSVHPILVFEQLKPENPHAVPFIFYYKEVST